MRGGSFKELPLISSQPLCFVLKRERTRAGKDILFISNIDPLRILI